MAQQVEKRLINEWLWEKHRNDPQWKRARLGPVTDAKFARMYSVLLRWADAIVFDGTSLIIVEGKIRPDPKAIGQLMYYKQELANTPEFTAYLKYPVKMLLLTTLEDKKVKEFGELHGVDYEVFSPPWVAEYWKERINAGKK